MIRRHELWGGVRLPPSLFELRRTSRPQPGYGLWPSAALPVHPNQLTFSESIGMSARGEKRPSAVGIWQPARSEKLDFDLNIIFMMTRIF
jgi:hypothetical protein